MNPLVSIIIPVYNVENYLLICLDSCFGQTYANIEVIAIDDGSTDNSGFILDRYALNEPRLKVIHQQNKGVVYARETGILHSKGTYICFVDSDDYIEKDMIYNLQQIAIDNNCDIVSCDFYIIDEKSKNRTIKQNHYLGTQRKDAIQSLLLRDCTWSLCGKLYKKELFNSVKMPYGLRVGEDGIVCFQVHNNSRKVDTINKPLYNYLQRKSSVTHALNKNLELDIMNFIEQIVNMKAAFHCGSEIGKAMDTFIASQIFVYYVNGGRLNKMIERIRIPFSIAQMMSLDLRVIEKVGVFVFLKMNYISGILRRLYIYATSH